MPGDLQKLAPQIERAVAAGQLMESTAKNIRTLLAGASSDVYLQSVQELVNGAHWFELNDRFYQTLAFGTGGLRGRTIRENRDGAGAAARARRAPGFHVGTGAMNFQYQPRDAGSLPTGLEPARRRCCETKACHRARSVFLKGVAEVTAKIAAENGCDALVFDGRGRCGLSLRSVGSGPVPASSSPRVTTPRMTTVTKLISATARK